MGRRSALLLPSCLLLLFAMGLADPAGESGPDPFALPESLVALYPPRSHSPLFLNTMLQLNGALAGIVVDLSERDMKGAAADFESFNRLYHDAADMVPEWKARYPEEPVGKLAAALDSGAPEGIMAAVGEVGETCHGCHVETMVPVQQRFHWPEFGSLTVQDPVQNADVPYPVFMQMLNTSLTGIGLDFGQGQAENARAQFDAFAARMAALKTSCGTCHDTERAYYVDAGIDSLVGRLGTALGGQDPGLVMQLSQDLGKASCSGCHLVHLPAAYSRR